MSQHPLLRERLPWHRRLHVEPLEDRRLLAVFTVNTELDTVDAADAFTSLREAIAATNTMPGPDEIVFDFAHDNPATILLTKGELKITDSLTINGPGANLLTIDASGNDPTPDVNDGKGSRIFRIDDGNELDDSPVAIHGLTLTGGDVLDSGGAILAKETLTVTSSTILGNSSYALKSGGGGIYAYGNVTVTSSTISGNWATSGGGIHANGHVTVTSSTISGNWVTHVGGFGVGGDGGGIRAGGHVTVTSSTISGNSADRGGGGIQAFYGPVTITNSIVAGNTGSGTAPDLDPGVGALSVEYSLVGNKTGTTLAEAPVGMPDAKGNLIGGPTHGVIDPKLGPLVDNGGLTFTHALLTGNPALNAGDPTAVAGVNGVPLYDQRGAPFARVVGNRIDMGAVESQPIPPAAFGDYNGDGAVDAADYVVWRATLGDPVTAFSGADGSGNGTIDQSDYQVWRSNFGATLPAPSPAVAAAMQNEAAATPLACDAWFSHFSVEAGSRSAASAISPGSAAVPTYPSGNVDLLLVLDAVPIDEDTIPSGTDALDAAFSSEDDAADLSDPPAVTLASL